MAASKQPAAGVPNVAFRGVLAKVIHASDAPVILPTYLPAWPGGYYISLGDSERDGWPVSFQSRLDGGPEDDSADVGFFDAEKITAHMEREPPGVPVLLTGGRTGHYRLILTSRKEFSKGEVWWNQGGVRYIIQWQTPSRKVLVQIANSVVRAKVGTGWPSAAAIERYRASHQDPKSGFYYDSHYGGSPTKGVR